MAKRILIFSTAYTPFVGGAEIALKEITERVKDFEFDMITSRFRRGLPKHERLGNIDVHRVGFGLGFLDKFTLPFLGYFKAKKLHKKNHYDLAWSMMASQASIAAAFFKREFSGVKLVLTLQEGDEEEHLKRYVLGVDFLYEILIKPWHVLVLKEADHVTAISNYLKERAKRSGAECPVDIIPNAVDVKHFSQEFSEEELSALKKEYVKREDEKLIITTSRLVKKNAVDDLIKSLIFLGAYFKLIILGTGPDLRKLKKLAREIGVNDRVFFLGHISHEEIPKYLKASDVFVRASLSEGMGNSFIEAMAAGIPVVGTPVGGIVDFLKDKETGLFCSVNDPKSISERVIRLLMEDKALRERMVGNAKKMIFEKYGWNLIAQQMKEVFHKLI